MKKFSRILGIVTAVIMIFSLFTIPAAIAADDAASITFDMISEEAPVAVTKNLNLISTLGSTAVKWASNNSAVIAPDGTVTRADKDTKVVLSAMVGTTTKTFEVIVPGVSTTVGSSEGFTKTSDLSEFVIESSASARYGTYSESTGKITGSDAEVSLFGNSDMLISQTGTNQSRVNRPIVSGARGLSGIVVVEKRIKANAGFNWYIKASDNQNIVQLMRTGTQVIANGSSEYRYTNYAALSSTEYNTYTVVLDTTSRTYSVYINGISPGEKMTNIPFNVSRNNVAAENDWLEVYPRVNGNKVYVDYSSVICYSDATSMANGVMQAVNTNDLLGENLSSRAIVSDLSLPTIVNGVEISWSSSSSAISNNGVVTRGDADVDVILTATFTEGTASVTKNYNFTVLKNSDNVIDATDFYSLDGYRGFVSQDNETAKIGTGFNRKIANFANPGKGYFSIESKFMIKSVEGKNSELQIRMPGSPSNSSHAYPITLFMTLTIDDKLTLTAKDGEKTITPISNKSGIIEHNEWFDLRIEFDTNLGKYYVYINDRIVSEDCMSIDIIEGTNYFTSVIFGVTGTTDAYIDSYIYKKVPALTYDEAFSKTIVFKDGDKIIEDVTDITGSSVSVSMNIFNPDGLSKKLYMIVASYSNGALYDCVLKNVDITSDNIDISTSADRELSIPTDKTTATIKCFTIERDTFVPFDGEEITLGYSAETEELKKKIIACWGDSLTYGDGATSGNDYPSVLAKISGAEVVNYGIGGETATTIAARQGGINIELLNGFTLNAEKGSTVTFDETSFKGDNGITVIPRAVGLGGWNPCYINGIEGRITADVDNTVVPRKLKSVTFTRTTSGEALTIASDEKAVLTTYASTKAKEADINVIFIGTNGGWGIDENNKKPSELIDIINRMISNTKNPSKCIVVGLTTGTSSSRSTLDEEMEKAFGEKFINMREYLSSEKTLERYGITATAQDKQQIASGCVPQSFWKSSDDSTHLNDYGYRAMAEKIYSHMLEIFEF